jgi:cysteinyl-tRNA synthetase
VSNITDIDDHIIDRANREGRTSEEIAVKCEAVWYQGMDAINVKRPTVDPHATAYVDAMIALVQELVDTGKAYVTSDGVYLSVETVPGYGLLAHQSLEDMRAGGGDRSLVGEEKRHPADFVLWKLAKPGEPSWDSPWGAGRPGWHTECVVMSLDLLGEGFDLHGGGRDLAFPHHENERAQAVALGREFASHWVHTGWVEVGGEKMSKSLGNFTNLLDLVEQVDQRAYRLLVLQSHYRSPLEISKDTTDRAERSLAGLDAFARRVATELPDRGAADPDTMQRFREVMDDDLDTPAAMALVFDSVRRVNAALDADDAAGAAPLASAVMEICDAVGLVLRGGVAEVPFEIAALAAQRDAARAAKDFSRADAIRGQLQADGRIVEDTESGTLVRRP